MQEAEELMKLCEPGVIDKIRYLVKSGEHIFEVDEFSAKDNDEKIQRLFLVGTILTFAGFLIFGAGRPHYRNRLAITTGIKSMILMSWINIDWI